MWSSTFKTKIGTTASMYVCLSASCLNKVLASTQYCLADDWQVTWLFTKLEFTAVTCLCARTVAEALFHVSEHRTGKAAESGHLWCCQNKKRKSYLSDTISLQGNRDLRWTWKGFESDYYYRCLNQLYVISFTFHQRPKGRSHNVHTTARSSCSDLFSVHFPNTGFICAAAHKQLTA